MKVVGDEQSLNGFSLIEMLAVVALFALMTTLVLPNLSLFQARKLRDQAERIADQLEYARQRSVMTSRPHRLQIDLDEASYRLEWSSPSDPEEAPAGPLIEPPEIDDYGRTPISLAPPKRPESSFIPVPGRFGKPVVLDAELFFAGFETESGLAETGVVDISFDRDGTTDFASIVLASESGGALTLEVLPLTDTVRIHNEEL
ncbi:prepilin-type N-terminal cleavage/methylation domain-containing protein [Myxococcota bacterium]|nr:prepilin-type N-terminal cleavage/methylation domain-containing protein [Myxococcota bacterium]